MTERLYQGDGLTLRIRGIGGGSTIRVHLEHETGAALIVPYCEESGDERVRRLETVGFDGTRFEITLDEEANEARIEASTETLILGGGSAAKIPREPDPEPSEGGVRVTGDEHTMPIQVE